MMTQRTNARSEIGDAALDYRQERGEMVDGGHSPDVEALLEALAHPEKYLSAEEIAEYRRCQKSIVESATWLR